MNGPSSPFSAVSVYPDRRPWKCYGCGWTNIGYVRECDGCGEKKATATMSRAALAMEVERLRR